MQLKGYPDGGIHKLDLVSHDIFLSATTFNPRMVLIRYFFIISVNIVTDPKADPLMSDFCYTACTYTVDHSHSLACSRNSVLNSEVGASFMNGIIWNFIYVT